MSTSLPNLLNHLYRQFKDLPDPRRKQGRRYPQEALLMLLVIGFLRGLRSIEEILDRFSHDIQVLELLGLSRVPAQGTYTNLFIQHDVDRLNRIFRTIGVELAGHHEQIAVDGKTLRGSLRNNQYVHVVNVSTPEGTVLSQANSALAAGEVTSALKQLDRLDLKDKTVTGDALYARRDLSKRIAKKGGAGSSS